LVKEPEGWGGVDPGQSDSRQQTPWEQSAQWFSRSLAAALIMVVPGIIGSLLDQRWGTRFLAPLGFGFGLTAGTAGLLVLVRRFSPPAGGKPLSWDGEGEEEEDKGKELEGQRRTADGQPK
jgi:hypothetical protein